jgi:hypothetical protein
MSRHVSCFPASDESFREAASDAFTKLEDARLDEVGQLLTDVLRSTYPAVTVHRQADLAEGFLDNLWYVYRDGSLLGTEADVASP